MLFSKIVVDIFQNFCIHNAALDRKLTHQLFDLPKTRVLNM